ncbi:hypothetical protein C0J52_26215 [Blattella germanica]|nr:hypothetical protein C0J52_26215 [Blattella germanica]
MCHIFTGRLLLCACTTGDCREKNKTTCQSNKCFTQYLEKTDGSDPLTKGCMKRGESFLCENRQPGSEEKTENWPYLVCCDDEDLCNKKTLIIRHPWHNSFKRSRQNNFLQPSHSRLPPPISPESPFLSVEDEKMHRKMMKVIQESDKTTARTPPRMEDLLHPSIQQAFRSFSPGSHKYNWPICKPVVLAVLVIGLILLIGILGFGFYILRSQSNYLRRFMQGYSRSPDEEETLNPVRPTANTQAQIPLIVNKIDKRPISNLAK